MRVGRSPSRDRAIHPREPAINIPHPQRPKLQNAGLTARLLALLLDALLLMLIEAPALWLGQHQLVSRLDDVHPMGLLANWGLPSLYFIGMWCWQGASFGKLVCGLRIVDAKSGDKPRPTQALLRWAGALLSALPLGLGLWWSLIDAQGRSWHDRLAGTRVVRRRASEPGEAGYLVRHWRGEQGLAQSFWINNVLLSVPLSFLVSGLMAWISVKGEYLQATAIAVLVGWPLSLAINSWCVVGAWRAAGRYLVEGGIAGWVWLARLLMGLAGLQILASLCLGFLPGLGGYWKMVRGIDPLGNARMSVSADGRSLRLDGTIGLGDAKRLRSVLESAPEVRRFELISPGGRVYEAEQMVKLIRAREGASTWVDGHCESACTLVFLAGSPRQLLPGAQLGFHRASSGTYNPVIDELANQQLAASYRELGLPEYFIDKTLKTPPQRMWYPRQDELVAHALVPEPPQTLDIALPPAGDNSAAAFTLALRANPAWVAVDQRFGGSIDAAAQRMQAARQAGASDELVQTEALQVLAAQMPALIVGLPAERRHAYVRQVQAQLQAAREQGGALCAALLTGQLLQRRQLPVALWVAESSWLRDAMDDPPARRLPGPPSAIELEVVRRGLGAQAPGMLAGLWRAGVPESQAPRCEAVLRTLERIPFLPVAQRVLAERLLFQAPS